MQVTVEDLSSVKKLMCIEIPETDVVRELDKAYSNLKKTAKIKGFRPGKIPRTVMERMFKKDVHADVSYKLIQQSFIEAITEKDLKVLGTPLMDTPKLEARGPYKYKATVEVKPQIGNIDFKGLTLKKTIYDVTDAEVDAQLKALQKNMAEKGRIKEDRPVADDDWVLMDYEGFKDGEAFEETPKVENEAIKIGAAYVTKDFDEQIKGMKSGDAKEFTVHFPADYCNAKLADQDILYRVQVKEIQEEVLPEINDDFARSFGDFNSLEKFKLDIVTNLKNAYENRSHEELKSQIFEALTKKSDFELPDSLVDFELESIVAEAQRSFMSYNTTLEQLGLTKETLSEKYRDVAENNVRHHLIINQIIEQENLVLSDEELEEGYAQAAERFRRPLDEIRKYYSDHEDHFDYFKTGLLEKKAIRLIIENGAVENVEPEKKEASADE
ncbi:MAG: trigger factor [Desulfobacterales bacterium]|nr:trigger factor [Desulfobacterales bacterium]MDD4071594.1 trigger factor [Desulfobacterales bacterium]MDD4392630.1 trigger factor [Desulfobacterales bacterium]